MRNSYLATWKFFQKVPKKYFWKTTLRSFKVVSYYYLGEDLKHVLNEWIRIGIRSKSNWRLDDPGRGFELLIFFEVLEKKALVQVLGELHPARKFIILKFTLKNLVR
jgi:hypothetical protein